MSRYTEEEAIKRAVAHHREIKNIIRKILNWDTDLTIPENAKAYKRSKVAVYKFAQKYQLQFRQRRGRKNSDITDRKRIIAETLRKEGWMIKEIAKILNCKHQYINQILRYHHDCDINETPTAVRLLKTKDVPPTNEPELKGER